MSAPDESTPSDPDKVEVCAEKIQTEGVSLRGGRKVIRLTGAAGSAPVRLVDAASGAPFGAIYASVGPGGAGEFAATHQGRTDGQGVLKQLPSSGGNGPTQPVKLLPGRAYRLAWGYEPISDPAGYPPTALIAFKGGEDVSVAGGFMPGGELKLEVRRPSGRLVPDAEHRFCRSQVEPVAGMAYRLEGPDGVEPLSGSTDAQGRLQHQDVPFATFQLVIGEERVVVAPIAPGGSWRILELPAPETVGA